MIKAQVVTLLLEYRIEQLNKITITATRKVRVQVDDVATGV
jgi:hypothetical protein